MPSPDGPVLPELRVWRALSEESSRGRPAVLAVVVSHAGSSPGRTGWLMAVGVDGWLAGTTGGGSAEAQIVDRSFDLLREPSPMPILVTQTHRRGVAEASGMVCGGQQVVALAPVPSTRGAELDDIRTALARGQQVAWSLTADGWTLNAATADGFGTHAQGWAFGRTAGPSHRVVVVGAGHVGSALARVLVPLSFRVSVVDERPGAAARLTDFAHETAECPYENLPALVTPSERTFVTVATHASDRDVAAISALAGVAVGYLGVIGSRAKLAHLPVVPHLVAPMGLSIGSYSAEEIAVSVAAQLVAARARCP